MDGFRLSTGGSYYILSTSYSSVYFLVYSVISVIFSHWCYILSLVLYSETSVLYCEFLSVVVSLSSISQYHFLLFLDLQMIVFTVTS